MLTVVEAVSLAGDRAKQNDDACGARGDFAWIIDGATDLHSEPVARRASDAAWLAGELAAFLSLDAAFGAPTRDGLRNALSEASMAAEAAFRQTATEQPQQRWKLPTASALLISESEDGQINGVDLGDCRCFALDADGKSHAIGGPPQAADRESQRAADAAKKAGATPLLEHAGTMDWLRSVRARHNTPDGYWVFGLQPECAEHARAWTLELKRPAHILLCTDGFSALVDRYAEYDPADLVNAALDRGLHDLARELRAIENADAGGALHPRWKRSDDATALLLRLT